MRVLWTVLGLAVGVAFGGHLAYAQGRQPRRPSGTVSSRDGGYLQRMDGFVGIYLRDQLALGVLWRELARRAAHNNRGTPLGEALTRVSTGIAEDVDTFRAIMERIGVRANPVKTGLAVAAERLGRLKLNGRLTGYSPLSRFMELEVLTMGIDGKKQLWTTLRDLAGLAKRLPDVDFDHLIDRAERQRAELEPFRVRTGTAALGLTGDAEGSDETP